MKSMVRAKLILDKDFTVGKTDEKLFSSFVEPLGRCIYGGIYQPGHPQADEQGFRKDVLDLTRALRLTMNRFPGGNYTSTYRWEDSIGPLDKRPRRAEPAWQSIETNEFGVDEFADWSRKNGSDVMMTVNLGTRGVMEAMDCVEYCNLEGGTYWSDLRRRYGHREPYGFRYWCLGNEMDGVWQIGQKTGGEYGRLAREASKGMKLVDPGIRTVLAGSSSPGMDTFPEFDAAALDEAYEFVDYLSVHQYIGNHDNDTPAYMAVPTTTERYLRSAASACAFIQAKKRGEKKILLSFDEFNVWHSIREEARFRNRWQTAPKLLEDEYTLEDALALGGMLLAVLRCADIVGIACMSELVNCIAHIRTSDAGGAWVLPPYYTYLHYSRYGRGMSLGTVVQSELYSCGEYQNIPYLDAAAVLREDESLTIFAINRSLQDEMLLAAELRGLGDYRVERHLVLNGPGAKSTNTEECPDQIRPWEKAGASVEKGTVMAVLPAFSWNVICLCKIQE